jgi:thioredoxin-related protein
MKELYTMIQSQPSALVMFSFEGCLPCEKMEQDVNSYLASEKKLDKTALIKLDVLDPNNAMILQNL